VRQHFTQKERDNETGLDYFLARYYSSTQGRFTSIDPDNDGADPMFPQSWNAYAYVWNRPTIAVDPDGRTIKICDNEGRCPDVSDADANKYTFNKEYARSHGFAVSGNKIFDDKGNQVGTWERTSFDDLNDFANGVMFGRGNTAGLHQRLAPVQKVARVELAIISAFSVPVIEAGEIATISIEAAETGGPAAVRTIATVGQGLKNLRPIGSGRLGGFLRGNTELPGGAQAAQQRTAKRGQACDFCDSSSLMISTNRTNRRPDPLGSFQWAGLHRGGKMSRVIQLLALVIWALFGCTGFAQGCKNSGATAWNEMTRDVVADCAAEFRSPNNRLLLKFASDGRISIKAKTVHLKGRRVEPPAMVSWSPRSDAFFIDDGEGSGMSSTFRLFRIKGTQIYEDKAVEKRAVLLYRRRTRCPRSALDPDVWGFGWGDGGKTIYLLIQATVHEPCGRSDHFMSVVIRTSDRKILEILSKEETRQRFSTMLPSSLFKE
jgi:RHS repeat-associated protein